MFFKWAVLFGALFLPVFVAAYVRRKVIGSWTAGLFSGFLAFAFFMAWAWHFFFACAWISIFLFGWSDGLIFRIIVSAAMTMPAAVGLLLFARRVARRWVPYAEALKEEVAQLEIIAAESNLWSDDEWRRRQIDANRAAYESNTDLLFRQWRDQRHKGFLFRAVAALVLTEPLLFLPIDLFSVVPHTRTMMERHAEEPIRRWEILTGKKRPSQYR